MVFFGKLFQLGHTLEASHGSWTSTVLDRAVPPNPGSPADSYLLGRLNRCRVHKAAAMEDREQEKRDEVKQQLKRLCR